MSKLKNYLNLFWPILISEHVNQSTPEPDDLTEISVRNDDLNYCLKLYDLQRDRIKTIESKSSQYISLFSILFTISLIPLGAILNKNIVSFYDIVLTIMTILSTLYIIKIIWHSLGALKARGYCTLSYKNKINKTEADAILFIIECVETNHSIINEKTDQMNLAHDTLIRLIILIFGFCIILFVISIIKYFDFSGVTETVPHNCVQILYLS